MWACTKCGEIHYDHFKECWKCVGEALEQEIAPAIAPSREERKLRSYGSILVRAAIAFLVGAIVGGAIASRAAEAESTALAGSASVVGLLFAGLMFLFVWVFFPYEPKARRQRDETTPIE